MSEKKKKKKKAVNKRVFVQLISIVLIVAAIVIFANVGKQIYTMYDLKQQSELVEKELVRLQDENATLVSTKNKLEDPNYVTTYARGEYMFSKGDEKVFYLPSSDSTSKNNSEETSH